MKTLKHIIWSKIITEMNTQVFYKIRSHLSYNVVNKLKYQSWDPIYDQVCDQFRNQVRDQVRDTLNETV